MGWIENRILAEKKKHEKSDIGWAKIAEAKIVCTIREILQELDGKVIQVDIGEYDKEISCFELMNKLRGSQSHGYKKAINTLKQLKRYSP